MACNGAAFMVREWLMGSTFEASSDQVDALVVDAPDAHGVDLAEAARQLQQASHDARVAFDCIGLDELDRAHTHAITARTAADAAENLLRVALGGEDRSAAGL
jgi:hypothetical protein